MLVKKSDKKSIKKSRKKVSAKKANKNKETKIIEKPYIDTVNFSKSLKFSLGDYGSIGLSFSVTKSLPKDCDVELEKNDLVEVVDKYLSIEIEKSISFYKEKKSEIESEIAKYISKLEELNAIKYKVNASEFINEKNNISNSVEGNSLIEATEAV